jgi:hypothetical protein
MSAGCEMKCPQVAAECGTGRRLFGSSSTAQHSSQRKVPEIDFISSIEGEYRISGRSLPLLWIADDDDDGDGDGDAAAAQR